MTFPMDASEHIVPDKELWHDFVLRGREDSFDVLVQRHKLRLFDVAFRVLRDPHAAEDIVQRVFIWLLQRKDELVGIESVQGWLYKATLNLSLRMKTSIQRRKCREKAEQISRVVETPRESAVRADLKKEIDLALEKLKDSSRIPLVLRYLHELSHVEVGRILGLSSDAARRRIRRGLNALKKLLKGRGLLVSVLAVEEGLRTLPIEAASAAFLPSAAPLIKAAATAGAAAKAAVTTASVVKGLLIMTAKVKIGIGIGAAMVAALVLVLSQRSERPSRASREEDVGGTGRRGPVRMAKRGSRIQEPAEIERPRDRSQFGMLGSVEKVSEWHHHLASALRWMREWGHDCTVVASPGADGASLRKTLRAEGIAAEACSFEEALKRFRVLIVYLGAEYDGAAVAKLTSYAASGGWLIVTGNQKLVRMVAGLTPGSPMGLGFGLYSRARGVCQGQGRFLAAHPVASGCAIGEWFRARPLFGEVELSKPSAGLWLMAFQNPLCPGIRVLPLEKGGILDISWEVRKGGSTLGGLEGREIFHNAIDWLAKKETWRAPQIAPGQRVVGKVVDEDGSSIPRAIVKARVFSDWGVQVGETAGETDDNGDFSLAATTPSIYWFDAVAIGFLPDDKLLMARCEEGDKQPPVRIVMRPSAELFGTVCYDAQEKSPAPGFSVKLLPSDRYAEVEPQETVSDQQGRFAFDRIPSGKTFLLVSQKEQWGGWKVVELPPDPEEEPRHLVLGVEPLPLVYGQVVEHETLRPVPGSRVHVSPVLTRYEGQIGLFMDKLERIEECAEDGSFSLYPLPGDWSLAGGAEGYVTFQGIGDDFEASPRLRVASGRAEPSSPIILKVELVEKKLRWPPPGTQFYGTVYMPTGEPAPEAFVACEGYVYRADTQGRYETEPFLPLHGLNIGGAGLTDFDFEARCGDFACQQSLLLPWQEPPPERHRVDLYLEAGEKATGFVKDRKGRPVEGAEVSLVSEAVGGGIWWPGPKAKGNVVASEADGSFTLPGLIPRSRPEELRYLRVRAKKTDATGTYVGEVDLRTPEQQPVEDFVIFVTKERMIRGTVSYADGTPLRNRQAKVSLRYGENREGPSWSQNEKFASFEGYLDDRGGFSFWVEGFRHEVNLEERETDPEDWHPSPEKPPDTYEVWVEVEETTQGATCTPGNVLIVKDVDVEAPELDLRFPPLGSIRWRLVDGQTGAPLERWAASAQSLPPHWTQPALTCWSGGVWCGSHGVLPGEEYHLADLVPGTHGTYGLRMSATGYCTREFESVRVEGNRTANLGDVPLYRNWWIKGRVIATESGKPVPASIEGPPGITAMTDAEGRFELTMTPEHESCEVKVIPSDKAWQDASIDVERPGQPVADVGDILLKRTPSESPPTHPE